eukprot:SAG31_NODE_3301_length_4442_cov_17.276076_5_plen_179_part_00
MQKKCYCELLQLQLQKHLLQRCWRFQRLCCWGRRVQRARPLNLTVAASWSNSQSFSPASGSEDWQEPGTKPARSPDEQVWLPGFDRETERQGPNDTETEIETETETHADRERERFDRDRTQTRGGIQPEQKTALMKPGGQRRNSAREPLRRPGVLAVVRAVALEVCGPPAVLIGTEPP